MGFMRLNALVTERLPGNIPLTRDLLKMLEAGDNVVTNDEAVERSSSRWCRWTSSFAGRPRGLQNPRDLENYERFKFEILFESTTDSQGIGNPCGTCAGVCGRSSTCPSFQRKTITGLLRPCCWTSGATA